MTGYGQASLQTKNLYIHTSIKTINNKYLDIQCHLPAILVQQEIAWRKLLAAKLQRGTITFSITLLGKGTNIAPSLNETLIKEYYRTLEQISKELNTNTDLLASILHMPATILTDRKEATLSQELCLQIDQVVHKAIEQCLASREAEGATLNLQLVQCVAKLQHYLAKLEEYQPKRNAELRARLEQKISLRASIVDNTDKNRWEQEILYYLEKMDIEEEKIRLQSHVQCLQQTIHAAINPIGKKLGFITQEIHRELNTIGAKAQNSTLQQLIITMKQIAENIKEQLQNLV